MEIRCLVQDPSGRALAKAKVVARGANGAEVAVQHTGEDGWVTLEQAAGAVRLEIFPPNWGEFALAVHYLPKFYRIPGSPRRSSAEVEVKLSEAFPVPLVAYDLDGQRLTKPGLGDGRLNVRQFEFYGLDDLPARGAVHWAGLDEQPYVLLSREEAVKLAVLWTAPGYGRVVCWADGRGRGFAVDGATPQSIFLNVEFARTAWRRLKAEMAACQRDGYSLSEKLQEEARMAQAAVAELEEARSEREQAKAADKALGLCLLAGETLVMERARQRIARHRNRERVVGLSSMLEGVKPGDVVEYRQVAHEFRFGCFVNPDSHPVQRVPLDTDPLWEKLREIGINQLPVPLLWSRLEEEEGVRKDEDYYNRYPADKLREAGFHLKDHISVWFWQGRYPDQWGAFTPDWVYDVPPEDLPAKVYENKKRLAERYYPYIKDWQAINEPMLHHTNGPNLTLDETAAVVQAGVDAVREHAHDVVIEVNSCQVFGEQVSADIVEQGYEMVPDQFYGALAERGVSFDAVGLQMYYGGYMHSRLFSGGFPIRHPWDLEAIIKRYARLGKPVRITEVSVPSSWPSPELGLDFGWWHGPWDLERQAEWVELFYTLCYSVPEVSEITWWNATDEGAFIKDGGLMFADYTFKPAAETLARLTNGWKGEGTAQVDSKGRLRAIGPAGEYEITVKRGEEIVARSMVTLR
ncbi:MAG TPA: hypothetical protein GX008_04825 [Firmicutes bacterium]|jgi:GH35 family endo-1,4-beta-xylanase|nr:hypothetical protein [Bacillota bacterium]